LYFVKRISFFVPSLAFFLLAKVPPSFPKNESSFFLEVGDLGVGDLGEDGDFCGDEAIAANVTLNPETSRLLCNFLRVSQLTQVSVARSNEINVHSLKRKRNSSHFLDADSLSPPPPGEGKLEAEEQQGRL